MNNIVYHGSNVGGLKEIKKHKSTHNIELVYASKNISVPLAFIRNKNNRDLDLNVRLCNGKLQITERRPKLIETIYNLDGYIYVLSSENFKSKDYLWKAEVVSDKDELVLKEIYVPNIKEKLEELNNNGEIDLYLYPNRPSDIPLDNSDLIEHCLNICKNYNHSDMIDKMLLIYPELRNKI